METPKSIEKDEANYKPDAWQNYSVQEMGEWVHLLMARAMMRGKHDKAAKDLADAQAYLDMMQAKLNDLKDKLR